MTKDQDRDLTRASKQAQLVEFFCDPESGRDRLRLTDQEVAKQFGCHPGTVARARDEIRGEHGGVKQELPLGAIVQDRRLQTRGFKYDKDTVDRYLAKLAAGVRLPDVVVVQVDADLYLVDGWQRFRAAERHGADTIGAEVVEGTWADAVLLAAKANENHGLVRTDEDRRRAVTLVLKELPEYRRASRRKIAEAADVTDYLVRQMIRRGELVVGHDDEGEFIRPATPSELARAEQERLDAAHADALDPEPETLENPTNEDLGADPEAEVADEVVDDEDDDAECLTLADEILQEAQNCPTYAVLSQPGREAQLRLLLRDIAILKLTEDARDQLAKAVRLAKRDINTSFPKVNKRGEDGRCVDILSMLSKLRHPRTHELCPDCGGDGCAACKHRGRV